MSPCRLLRSKTGVREQEREDDGEREMESLVVPFSQWPGDI